MTVPSADTGDIMTPTARAFLRRSLFWIGITTVILIIAIIGVATTNSATIADPLASDSAAPVGAKALVEVLGHEGVAVTSTSSLRDTKRAITDPAKTTLLVYDYYYYLDVDQYRELLGLASTIVLVEPNAEALALVSPQVYPAGYVGPDALPADCSLPSARAAKSITGSGSGYRVPEGDSSIVSCFDSGDTVRSLVQVTTDSSVVTVLGASDALSNGTILENGNAALALQLLGSQPNLVWYLPTATDLAVSELTVADLSPGWVQPVALTLILTALAAALWRGRRLGPLIIENLPVTVRASETMQGRARLYQQGSARLHAVDALRIGTVDRLATLCGLPRLATLDEVVSAVAAATATDEREVRRVLVDAVPSSDAQLLALSDDLLTLERETARRVRPQ